MKIDNYHRIIVQKIYNDLKSSQQVKKGEGSPQEQEKDTFVMSSEAKQIQEYLNELKTSEANREERIQQLKEKIEAGNYKVDTELLARKMLDMEEGKE